MGASLYFASVRNQQAKKQLARYLDVDTAVAVQRNRASWLAFYFRLETLFGEATMRRYRLLAVLMVAGAVYFLIAQGMEPLLSLGLVALVSAVSVYFAVKHLEQAAVKAFNQQMPDIIDSMVRAVKVGAPLHDIFMVLSEQYPGVASRLFRAMHDRLKLGHSVDHVMSYAYQQLPSPEFQFLTILLSLQHETGGKLSHMLNQLASTLRERSMMESRIRTITSESRTSARVLSCLPFVLMGVLYTSAREHFDYLFTDDKGQWILFYVVISVFVGLLLIRQLTRMRVS
nr:type II secretion system F family protein [Thaumasiovibrio subtropicus]